MSLAEPYPGLDELLAAIGIAGQRLASIEASEGAAGNISIFIGWPLEVRRHFPTAEPCGGYHKDPGYNESLIP